MTPLEQYVDAHVIVINLARRRDRWKEFEAEMEMLGIEHYTRFEAYDGVVDGKHHGHFGCVASHRAVLEIIGWSKWKRCLVFEDDCQLRREFYSDWKQRFETMIKQVPEDASLIYLGGHYGNDPIARVSENVIRCDRMLTTSSYIITHEAARRMAPHISGVGPIDILYSGFAQEFPHYILEPRLFIQREGWSDLLEEKTRNEWAMTDTAHVKRLDARK